MNGTARRPDPSSAPDTLSDLGPSPSVDAELLWFFNVQDGDFASSSNFGRMLSSVDEVGDWLTPEDHLLAAENHRVIRARLKSISDSDAGVLQCAYLPRPWPVGLVKALRRLTGIVVRLSCDRETWPSRRAAQLSVDAENAKRLDTMIRAGGSESHYVLHDLRREAQHRFAQALGEYAMVGRRASLSRRS